MASSDRILVGFVFCWDCVVVGVRTVCLVVEAKMEVMARVMAKSWSSFIMILIANMFALSASALGCLSRSCVQASRRT